MMFGRLMTARPRWKRPSITDRTWCCWTSACRDSTVMR